MEQNRRLVRRDWLAEELGEKLREPWRRFILITAEPGTGKSAFMARLAHGHPRGNAALRASNPDHSQLSLPFGDSGGHVFAAAALSRSFVVLNNLIALLKKNGDDAENCSFPRQNCSDCWRLACRKLKPRCQSSPAAPARSCGLGADVRTFSCTVRRRPCALASARLSECPRRSRCRSSRRDGEDRDE